MKIFFICTLIHLSTAVDKGYMRMYPLPHPAGDNENVEYDKCPEASDEKAAAASFEYCIHRNFFGRQSEILEDKNRFIEPHDDDPGDEKRCEQTRSR